MTSDPTASPPPERDAAGHRRYLIVAAVVALVCLSPLAGGAALLWRGGELLSVAEVAAAQQATKAIYGTAVHGNDAEHRLALIAERKPRVVAMGSSRMEQMRQDYFAAPFACLCTAMGEMAHGPGLMRALLTVHRPDIVLLGLDYWWFADSPTAGAWTPSADPTGLTVGKLVKPLTWVGDGTLSAEAARALLSGDRVAEVIDRPAIGVAARLTGRGVRADGSAFHGDVLFADAPRRPSQDIPHVLEQVRDGGPYYPHDLTPAPDRLALLEETIALGREAGVTVIPVLTPMMPTVAAAMARQPGLAYVEDIHRMVAEAGAVDAFDATALGAGDCGFLDDRHGGDGVYMRLLEAIAATPRGAALAPYLSPSLDAAIAAAKGRALARFDASLYPLPEGDFLALGCKKGVR